MSRRPLRLKRIRRLRVASFELTGPYENWGRGLMELKGWLEKRKIATVGPPIGLFYDNPRETPPQELRSEACIPIKGEVASEGRFRIKDLPESRVASTKHRGPPEEYSVTYGSFLEKLLRPGYVLDGPAREIFDRPSPHLSPGKGVVIQQPVRRC